MIFGFGSLVFNTPPIFWLVDTGCRLQTHTNFATSLQPVFTSHKIGGVLKTREPKPKIITQQCVVYSFKCGLCDMDYVGYINRHLHQRVAEHGSLKPKTSEDSQFFIRLLRITMRFPSISRMLEIFSKLLRTAKKPLINGRNISCTWPSYQ